MNEPLSVKRQFSRIGWALFAIAAITTVLQIIVSAIWYIFTIGTSLAEAEWATWVLTFFPMYLIAVPIGLAIMRTVPAEPKEAEKLGAKRFWKLMLIGMPIMYGGNIIGTVLSMLLSGGTAENMLLDLISGNPIYTLIFVVLIAPFLEEYIFRKQIIDRLGCYGEKTAIFVSALTFGLFHMNFFQFFYAFGLGAIFAYVYIRTRSLRYPVFMHMIVNFQGSFLAPMILQQLDPEVLEQLTAGILDFAQLADALPGLLIYMAYSSVLMLAVVAGLVLLIQNWKKREFCSASQELPAGSALKTATCNAGMIVFAVFCLIMILFSLLNGML